MTGSDHLFAMAVALKEWALVCEALGRGDQSVLLRKGGIAEGSKGFGFDHPEFYLVPTWYHGQIDKVRIPSAVLPEHDPDCIVISHVAFPEWTGRISDPETVRRLEPLHVLDRAVIEERFAYDTEAGSLGGRGIQVAFVRMFRMEPARTLPMQKSYRGCRSWIELPDGVPSTLVSVISDEEHARRKSDFCHIIGVSW